MEKTQVEQYREEGYTLIEDLLSERDLDYLDEIVPLVTGKLMERPDEKEHIFEKDSSGTPVAVRCVHNLPEQDEFFRELAARPGLLELVSRMMSSNLFFFRGIMVVKERGVGSAFPWHQDFAYWGKGSPELAGVWIALKDATVNNGCLEVIPGSHRWGVLPMINNDPGNPVLTPEQESLAAPVPVPAGGAILFHSLLVHRSSPNRSDHDRWAIVYEYSAPEFSNGRHRFDRSCGWDPRTNQMLELPG